MDASPALDLARVLLDGGGLIVALAAFVYAHIQSRRRATREQFAWLEERLARNTERLAAIESDLRHVPEAQVMHDMRVALEEVRGSVKAMAAEMTGFKDLSKIMHRQIEIMDTYLRSGNKS